jgi:hypothetical protein
LLIFSSSALAAPTAESAPFRIGVTVKGKTLYVTGTETASENVSDGILCTINEGKIGCGPEKLGFTYGNMHTSSPMVPELRAANNKNWSINPDNTISWKTNTGKDVHFSTKPMSQKKLYAEICSVYKHPDAPLFIPGVPKAYFA